jgi:HSP20 family protein
MTLIRWNPTSFAAPHDLPGIQEEVSRLFDSCFTPGSLRRDRSAAFTPSVDIEETAQAFIVRADLPGVAQEDVKVSLMGDVLTLRGTRRPERATGEGSLHRRERATGVFERSFSLGSPVRGDQVKAQVRDGVLEVRVPKAEEARARDIEIQAG